MAPYLPPGSATEYCAEDLGRLAANPAKSANADAGLAACDEGLDDSIKSG
jgi:hypothetical protein